MTEGRRYCAVLMRCPICGAEDYLRPVFVPAATPLYTGHEERLPIYCGAFPPRGAAWQGLCRGILEVVPGFNHDLTLHNFEVDMETLTDGKVQGKQRISSLHEIRRIEGESLRRHEHGEGQPMVFRDLSQNRSNRGTHTLTNTIYEKGRAMPKDEALRRARTTQGHAITGGPARAAEVGG